jgi:integrase
MQFTGQTVNAHLFRHIAATTYLKENSSGYEVVRRTLGHRSLTTSLKNYRPLEESRAREEFADIVKTLNRQKAKDSQRGARQKSKS